MESLGVMTDLATMERPEIGGTTVNLKKTKHPLDGVTFFAVNSSQNPQVSPERGRAHKGSQLQHHKITASALRTAVVAWWSGSATTEQVRLHRDLREKWLHKLAFRLGEDASHVLDSWLGGGDFEAMATNLGWNRRTPYRWIDRFLRYASYCYYVADHQTLCEETHWSSGGDGGTPPIGRREHSAGSCEVHAMLKAATWEGWLENG